MNSLKMKGTNAYNIQVVQLMYIISLSPIIQFNDVAENLLKEGLAIAILESEQNATLGVF